MLNVLRVLKPVVLVSVICMVVSGCQTPPQSVDTRPRFHEGASVNVVLEFNKWDHLFIKRPELRDDGFLRPLRREELARAFDTLHVQRGMAAVVLGWNYSPEQTAEIVEEWKSILGNQGFRRVVCLRADDTEELDGKVIVSDWKQSTDAPKQTALLNY